MRKDVSSLAVIDGLTMADLPLDITPISSFSCENVKFNKTQNVVVDQPQLLHFIFDILCRYI